jgi:hypothetical protein
MQASFCFVFFLSQPADRRQLGLVFATQHEIVLTAASFEKTESNPSTKQTTAQQSSEILPV